VERNYKLPKYTLDVVAEHFLGKRKDDVSARGLFMIWQLTEEILLCHHQSKKVTLLELIKYRKKVSSIFPVRRFNHSQKI
jgi:DNA polymerase elongation subunit (family B)